MRVLVCGGRGYDNITRVVDALDALHAEIDITLLIHGDCRGADTLAGSWAKIRGIQWEAHPILPGESGFARNERMLLSSEPDLVVHFPGGNGTKHMTKIAQEAGVRTHGGLAGPLNEEPRLI